VEVTRRKADPRYGNPNGEVAELWTDQGKKFGLVVPSDPARFPDQPYAGYFMHPGKPGKHGPVNLYATVEEAIQAIVQQANAAGVKTEGSTAAANVKGVSAPSGVNVVRRNPNPNIKEAELFERAVAMAVLNGENLQEKIQKKGDKWVVLDDKTGAQKGSYGSQKAASDKQKSMRKASSIAKKKKNDSKPKTEKKPQSKKPKLAPGAKKAPKPKVAKEALVRVLTKVLSEASMLQYVFSQPSMPKESLLWKEFIAGLPRETVMADNRLRSILQGIAKVEVKMLGTAVESIKKVLESTKTFVVQTEGVDEDPRGDIVMNFLVGMNESGQNLRFSVKLENGRPMLLFPPESRHALNAMANDESKLLRAELMHVQETVLDNMGDVLEATQERDNYLKSIEERTQSIINNMGPLEYAMLRRVLKHRQKGAK
jgi:hypothetical protein